MKKRSTIAAVTLLARVTSLEFARGVPLLIVSSLLFVLVCEHLIPLVIVRRDPERVLEILLPSFDAIARLLKPLTASLRRLVIVRRPAPQTPPAEPGEETRDDETDKDVSPREREEAQHDRREGEARQLLRSLVEFRETMVREVMTPRPDIVAIDANATIGDLLTVAREQQYSRIPVYNESLDNIVGMISIKDLILLDSANLSHSISPLIRPTHFVPETKMVPELLAEFQRKRIQAAMVVDEYGGTAGLVTIEDLLEEIVGEIRDEYDTELEPIVDEGDGVYVFSGRTHVRELEERLRTKVEGDGYETVGGYLLAHVGRVPAVGETFEIDGLSIEVLEAERRRIHRVRVKRLVTEAAAAEQA